MLCHFAPATRSGNHAARLMQVNRLTGPNRCGPMKARAGKTLWLRQCPRWLDPAERGSPRRGTGGDAYATLDSFENNVDPIQPILFGKF